MNKNWWTSKTIWVALAGLVSAILLEFHIQLTTEQLLPIILAILSLLGISLRDAI